MQTNPYLNFDGQTEEAFTFYAKALGGDLEMTRYKDMPMDGVKLADADADKIMHAQIIFAGGACIMGSDPLAAFGHSVTPGNNVHISLQCDSKEQALQWFAALSEGGTVFMEPADQAWGTFWGNWADKFGVQWMVNFGEP